MKYLVTGAAGFIGSHVCEALLKRGDCVVGVDNFNDYYDPRIKRDNIAGIVGHRSFDLCEADITHEAGMQCTFTKEQPDKVIHLAARAGVRPSLKNPKLYYDGNVTGTAILLDLAQKSNVKNFIFASSSSVYGERAEVPFRETDPADTQISPYGVTKRLGELWCWTYAKFGLPATCLRFFTVYGPRGRPDMAPYKFMRSIMRSEPIEVYGDGASRRDYTFIDDIVEGVLAATDADLRFEIINLGNSSPVELNVFIETLEKIVGKNAIRNPQPRREGDVSQTYADVSKAEKLLGWKPHTSLEDGLRILHAYLCAR